MLHNGFYILIILFLGKKLSDDRVINGKGRLTNSRIDVFQSIYGSVLRKNKGNPKAMSQGVIASLKHYCSTDNKPQHDDCPKGADSWCKYQSDLATGNKTYRPPKEPIAKAIQDIIEPVFLKLGNENFLESC